MVGVAYMDVGSRKRQEHVFERGLTPHTPP